MFVYILMGELSDGTAMIHGVHRTKEFASQVMETMNENLQLLDYEPNVHIVEQPLFS